MHTGNGTVERATQSTKHKPLANMEDGNILTESVNRAPKVMRFTIHGTEKTPFEIHHCRKPRTKLINLIKDGNSFVSDWSELSILAPNKLKNPIHVGRDADGETTNHMVMARTKPDTVPAASAEITPKNSHCLR